MIGLAHMLNAEYIIIWINHKFEYIIVSLNTSLYGSIIGFNCTQAFHSAVL